MTATLLALALVAAAAWTSGAAALAGMTWPSLRRHERLCLETIAGLGIVSLALTTTLLLHLFDYAVVLLALLAAVSLAVAAARRRPPAAASSSEATPARRATTIVLALAAIACAGAIAPVTDRDALSYVLPIARRIASEGALRVWADQAPSMWPLGHTVLLAFLVRSGGDRLAALSALEWLLAIGAIGALARRACARVDHAPLAIVLAVAAPAAAFQVSAAKEDLLLLAATAGALFCLSAERRESSTGEGEAAAAGLFAGVAAGVKYPGLGVAVATVSWIAIASPRGLRVRCAAAALATAAAIAGVWYALNLWRFGNPVAPFVFGAPGTPLDAHAVGSTLTDYGAGRGATNFVLTPVRLFVESWRYCGRAALFNPLVYAGLAALVDARSRRRSAPLVFTAAVLYTGWYLTLQNARLLLPAALALAPPAADVLAPMLRRRLASGLAALALGAPFLLAPAVGVVRAARYLSNPATYLTRETEHYDAVAWANAHLDPSRHRVLATDGAVGLFTVPAIGLDMLHQLEFDEAALADHHRLLAECRGNGVTHVLAARGSFADVESELRVVYENPTSRLGDVHFFRPAPVEAVALYEIAPAPN